MPDNTLTLTINGKSISGWQRIRVTRGVERCPNDFDIALTEHFHGAQDIVVQPGDKCQVKIGGDLVVTGYINRYNPSITSRSHTVRIAGRGNCQDLVDCSVEWPNMQIVDSFAVQIAEKLAGKYGITVKSDITETPLQPIKVINLFHTETPWEIIERVCRYRSFLAYEVADGTLFLTRVGSKEMASGFKEGQNIQMATVQYADDRKYSEYHAYRLAVDPYRDIATDGNTITVCKDESVKRYRKLSILAEGGDAGDLVIKQRAEWEKNRRVGRSMQLKLVTDSWRDSSGKLWEPNTLVPLDIPTLKLPPPVKWLIGEVTYRLDENGTTAELVMMHPSAYSPSPILLEPAWRDIPLGPY